MPTLKFTSQNSGELYLFKLVGGESGTETIAYTTKDGRMFWRGKEIKNEVEFRALVLHFTASHPSPSDKQEQG